jgi:hypothetical protein
MRTRFILLALPLLLLSCNGPHRGTPVTESDALPLVRALVASASEGNRDFFDSKVDRPAFIERATTSLGMSGLEQSVAQFAIFQKMSLGQVVVDDIETGGSYRFLRLHDVDGETRALVRIITPSGELNYHDIVLGYESGSGDVMIRDLFAYKIGELLSRTYGVLMEDLMRDDSAASKHPRGLVAALDSVMQLASAGNVAEARSYFKTLPPEQRRAKMSLSLYLTLSSLQSSTAYREAVGEYLSFYPSDTGSAMLEVDRGMIDNDYDAMLKSLERLNRIVGGDPYLDDLRGSVMAAKGDTAAGLDLMRKAIAREPDLAAAYWPCIDILVSHGGFAEARRLLEALEHTAMVKREVIVNELHARSDVDYTKFLASREYVDWSGS